MHSRTYLLTQLLNLYSNLNSCSVEATCTNMHHVILSSEKCAQNTVTSLNILDCVYCITFSLTPTFWDTPGPGTGNPKAPLPSDSKNLIYSSFIISFPPVSSHLALHFLFLYFTLLVFFIKSYLLFFMFRSCLSPLPSILAL